MIAFSLGMMPLKAQEDILKTVIDIVSPVEVSDLIKKQGIKYDKAMLSDPKNLATLKSDFKKALNLGVYSTDMGYSTINEKSFEALGYLTGVKKLAEAFKVSQYIDMSKITALAANKKDINKLLDETTSTFENISNYLEKQKKSNLAALMITGGWIETFHITCQVAKSQTNKEVRNELNGRIITQKIVLEKITQALAPYQTDADVANLLKEFDKVNGLLAKYKIEEEVNAKKEDVKEENGIISVAGDKASKDVEINDEDLNKIADAVAKIRISIIK